MLSSPAPTGLISLTLQWAQLPREGEEAGGESSSTTTTSQRRSDSSSEDAGSDLDELLRKAADGADDGPHCLRTAPLAPATAANVAAAAAAHGARSLLPTAPGAPPQRMSRGPLPPPPSPAVVWARRVAALLPRLASLTLDSVEGLTHDVLDALLLPPPSLRSQRPLTAHGTAPPPRCGRAGEDGEGRGCGERVCSMGAEEARKEGSNAPGTGGTSEAAGGGMCGGGGSGSGGLPCLRYLAVGDFRELCARRLARLVEQRGGGGGARGPDGGGGWGWGCPLERVVLVGCGVAREGEVQAALLAARRSSQLQLTWMD